MQFADVTYNWLNSCLEKLETPEQTKRRKLHEVASRVESMIQYNELQRTLDYCQELVEDIYGPEESKATQLADDIEVKPEKPKVKKQKMQRNSWIEETAYYSRIDTLLIKNKEENFIELSDKHVKGTQSWRSTQDASIIKTKYNPNNYRSEYSNEYKLSQTKANISAIHEILTVLDANLTNISRIDISTDIDRSFDEISKFIDLTHKCIRANDNRGASWCNLTEESLSDSNYLYRNRNKYEIEFYNKHKQSGGRAPMPTRMEIRFTRVSSKRLEFHIDKAIKLWREVPNNLAIIEARMIELLSDKWIEENQKHDKISFTTFVFSYSKYIYTLNILKQLYARSGLSNVCSSWLQDYRKCCTSIARLVG